MTSGTNRSAFTRRHARLLAPLNNKEELETSYAVGPLDTTNGNDIVLWVVVRSHHLPRNKSEEIDHLPYHYEGFSIVPRSFEVFREPDHGGHGGHGR